jgi:hypothetical protein
MGFRVAIGRGRPQKNGKIFMKIIGAVYNSL